MSQKEGVGSAKSEWNELYRVLSHPRRRHVLDRLYRVNRTLSIRSLAKMILQLEGDQDGTVNRNQEVERIHVSLHHSHLPLLVGMDLVQWNRTTDEVTLTQTALELPLFGSPYGGLIEIARPEATPGTHHESAKQAEGSSD